MDVKKFVAKLEQEYKDEKNQECEELHNALAQVLADKKATIQNSLYVLEMLHFELLAEKFKEVFK